MITASLVVADTRRLKPKSNQQKVQVLLPHTLSSCHPSCHRASTSSNNGSSRDTKPLPSLPSHPLSPSRLSRTIDPALAIETLLARSRLSGLSSAVPSRSLLEIGEEEWTGNFVAGDPFLSSLLHEPEDPRLPFYDTSRSAAVSSSSTATSTQSPVVDDRPPSRSLRRPRPSTQPASLPSSASSPHDLGVSPRTPGSGSTKPWPRHGDQQQPQQQQQQQTVGSGNVRLRPSVLHPRTPDPAFV